MQLLVTGSGGGIGQYLVPMLRANGHTVRTLDCVASSAHTPDIIGDVCDLDVVRAAVEQVEAVIHLGGASSDIPGEDATVLRVNVEGTSNVLLACETAGITRVVVMSSINALGCVGGYGVPARLPIHDAEPPQPVSAYQISKHLVEQLCIGFARRSAMTITCLRPVWVALPHVHYASWGALATEDLLTLFRHEYWAYVDVRDVCAATERALFRTGGGCACALLSAADTIAPVPTADLVARYCPDIPVRLVPDAPFAAFVDCREAYRLLGWRPHHSWRDAS